MLGKKNQKVQQSTEDTPVVESTEVTALRIELAKTQVELETVRFKLDQSEEKREILSQRIRELERLPAIDIAAENKKLKDELAKLRFDIENDASNVELKTENGKLKATAEIQAAENKYLRELLDTYRSMPDVKKMIESLSSIAVPNIAELREFSKTISESGVDKLVAQLRELISGLESDRDRMMHRGFRY